MASELFLGPDGGPYVSVNENSGDIELKDNSGNVVAFWDESNTQWDVQTNDIQNVGSLGVGSLSDGVAGSGNSIDAVAGTSGEIEVIGIVPYIPSVATSFSTTKFVELGGLADRPADFATPSEIGDLTNQSGDLKARVVGAYNPGSDQDATFRFASSGGTEQTVSPGDSIDTPWGDGNVADPRVEAKLETQTNGDEGEAQQMSIVFGKERGQQ